MAAGHLGAPAKPFRKWVGRPFQDRFKALVVEPGAPFVQVCDYIHLNPVRAGAVEARRMLEYPWSSLPKWSRSDRPGWLTPVTALGEPGGLPDSKSGWKQFVAALEMAAVKIAQTKRSTSGKMSRGWCLGSADFRAKMKSALEKKGLELQMGHGTGLDAEAVREERAAAWERQLQDLAKSAKVNLARLPTQKSDPAKCLLAAVMKRTASASNAWIAQRLQMGRPASASQFARRFLLTRPGQISANRLLSRVKT